MALFYSLLALSLGLSQAAPQGNIGGSSGRPGGGGAGQFAGGGFGGQPGATAPTGPWSGLGQSKSPDYSPWIFQYPLPIPPVATPEFSQNVDGRTVDYYSATIEPFQTQIYPNLGKANMVGYNGIAPGPTYKIQRGRETIVRYYNKNSVSAAVHLHGSYTQAAWDGWAEDDMLPGQWKDYYYPNSESARSIWYHDHAEGHTASDAYYGQAGVWIIYDPAEDSLGLPTGQYDVPLAITDKAYQSNGDLQSPEGNIISFFGDVIHVNGQPWPYLNVEPRKYRFRLFDMSLSRPYDLYLEDPNGNLLSFQVIASDSGLLSGPVTTSDVVISMGERYEIVVDFSAYKGQNITMKNGMEIAVIDEFDNTDKVMSFVVGNSVSDSSNNGAVPSVLNANIDWPAARDTVDHTFSFQMGGDNLWTINGISFEDVNNRVLARPPQGTVETWNVVHSGGFAVHPVHIHLVNMQVVSRWGGSRGVLPYEANGLKDVVLLEPGETAQVRAVYGPWNGLYMFHCHNLIHEDNAMMAAFNVTMLSQLGYEFNSSAQYDNPTDTRFVAQDYSAADFEPPAISAAVSSLAKLNPYGMQSALEAAEDKFWATAGYNGDTLPTGTVAPKATTSAKSTATAKPTATTGVRKTTSAATTTWTGSTATRTPPATTTTARAKHARKRRASHA